MTWKDNRRRKRIWYRHYRALCEELIGMLEAAQRTGTPLAGEAVLKMFFDLYESRRLHKRRRVANSAFESLVLAATDTGLTRMGLQPNMWTGPRPPAIGEFGARTKTSTAEPDDVVYAALSPSSKEALEADGWKEIPF